MTKFNNLMSVLSLVCLFGVTTMKAQYAQTAKIVSENREDRAEYGTSVAMIEDFAIVGASRETFASGAAYVYVKDAEGVWSNSQRLTAFDPNDGAEFGGGVKFSEDYLVVAAGRADVQSTQRAGALYIYDYQNSNWEYSTKLVATDYSIDAKLGMNPTSMDVEGNTIVAGAPGENVWTGSVYVFTREAGTWTETQKILSPTPQQSVSFGIGVSISGDYLMVGANEEDGGRGAVYVYLKDVNGLWEYDQTLEASDAAINDYFGTSVSLSGEQLVVGAYGANSEEGSAYIFERDNEGTWVEVQKLNGATSTEGTQFGWSTDIQPNYMAVSAPHIYGFEAGEVYFFKREGNGTWVEDQVIQGADTVGEDFYGWSVAMFEKQLIVGAPWEDEDANGENTIDRAGSAYIFENPKILGGIAPPALKDTFRVYPVPAKNYISIAATNGSISKIRLINPLGMTIKKYSFSATMEYSVDVSNLAEGVYFVEVTGEDGKNAAKKIIKTN